MKKILAGQEGGGERGKQLMMMSLKKKTTHLQYDTDQEQNETVMISSPYIFTWAAKIERPGSKRSRP